MTNFLEKVFNGFTVVPNQVLKLLTDGAISHTEFITLIYVLTLNNFRRHKTSRKQLEKVLRITRKTVAKTLNSLCKKKLIEIEECGLYIIIHSNITINTKTEIELRTVREQNSELDDYVPEQDLDDENNSMSNQDMGSDYSCLPPQPESLLPTLHGSQLPTIETRYKNKIEDKKEYISSTALRADCKQVKRTQIKDVYKEAYIARYGVEPAINNAKSKTLFRNLGNMMPLDEAKQICKDYLKNNDQFFVKSRHPLGLMMTNIDKIRVDAKLGRVTFNDSKRLDLAEANNRAYEEFLRGRK